MPGDLRKLTTRILATIGVATLAMPVLIGPPATGQSARTGVVRDAPAWKLSKDTLPVGKDKAIGIKIDDHRVLWVGGGADDPQDKDRVFIYDVDTRTSHEVAAVPALKHLDAYATAGVLQDGTVVVVGGDVDDPAQPTSRLSYRYDPTHDTWTRTGDLPEPQGWDGTPTTTLRDGRLLSVGGFNHDTLNTGVESRDAFVFNVHLTSTIDVLDPATGQPTGATATVQGAWDYTRSATTHKITKVGRGHDFGNAVLLNDGRVFVSGGHRFWSEDESYLARLTDYFDPKTGEWTAGAPLPTVAGEDSQVPNSHGGRAHGTCVSVLNDGRVVIAGGATQTDGQPYFDSVTTRKSIVVMTPRPDPAKSTYRLAPHPIPSGADYGGGPGGGDGRNQLLCYDLGNNRVLIAGGQDDVGADLYDSYVFDACNGSVTPGPMMVHAKPVWATQHPEWGYPSDYETAVISSREVGMANSKLVFGHHQVFVHGGAYDGAGDDTFLGTRYIEQLTR